MKPFCASGLHCERCRDREKGFRLRADLVRLFQISTANHFDCPHGIEWGYVAPPRPRQLDEEKTTPEKERRKAKQGGCCGSPTG